MRQRLELQRRRFSDWLYGRRDVLVFRYLAAEGSFTKPAEVTIEGSADTFRFTSFQDSEIYAIAGKVGFPTRRLRFYGQVGTNYHRSTSGTSETVDDVTVTHEDGTETVVEGGVQTFNLRIFRMELAIRRRGRILDLAASRRLRRGRVDVDQGRR